MTSYNRFDKRGAGKGGAGMTHTKAVKAVASPVEGVDMLAYGMDNRFIAIRQQLSDKLREDYGELASFVLSGVRSDPEVPSIDALTAKWPALSEEQVEKMFPSMILAYEKRSSYNELSYSRMFGTICRIMSEELRDKVERAPTYLATYNMSDPVMLWNIVTSIAGMHVDPGDDTDDAGVAVKLQYQARFQSKHESMLSYYNDTTLLIKNMRLLNVPDAPTERTAARDFLAKMDPVRYGSYYAVLKRNVRIGTEVWPATILAAYEDVEASVPNPAISRAFANERQPGRPAVFAVTNGGTRDRRGGAPSTDDKRNGAPSAETLAKYPCKGCGQFGHWLRECPKKDAKSGQENSEKPKVKAFNKFKKTTVLFAGAGDDAVDDETSIFMMQHEVKTTVLSAVSKQHSPLFNSNEVVYDCAAECHVFQDERFLVQCREEKTRVRGVGGATVSRVGALPGFPGRAVVLAQCPANLLSGIIVDKIGYEIIFKQNVSYSIVIDDSLTIIFDKRDTGFYTCDFSRYADDLAMRFSTASTVGVTTVRELENDYSKREIARAGQARELQRSLAWPSTADLVDCLRAGTIVNCPVSVEDVMRAEAIWGGGVAIHKGKTTEPGPTDSHAISLPRMPRKVQTLHSDILVVLGVPLLITVAKPLNLLIASEVPKARKAKEMAVTMLAQVSKLRAARFEVANIFVDGETPLLAAAPILANHNVELICTGTGEHVVVAERAIRVVKERVRCIITELPWELPVCWVKYLVYYAVTRINSLPRSSGSGLSAREEFRGTRLNYMHDLTLCFGDYVQAYRAPLVKNSMDPRTYGAIALCPMDNLTRSWLFMNLLTGRTFSGSKWTLLPTPDIVVNRVREIAKFGGLPPSADNDPVPPLIDTTELPVAEERLKEHEPLHDVAPRNVNPDYPDEDDVPDLVSDDSDDDDDEDTYVPVHKTASQGGVGDPTSAGSAEPSVPLRRSERAHQVRKVFAVTGNMSLGRALKIHGDVAEQAVRAELEQMINKGVFKILTPSEARGKVIIQSHMFMKEKRDQLGELIKVKARLVAGGNEMDKSIYTADRTTSPTIHVESLFMILALAAILDWKVSSVDVEGAFLDVTLPSGVVVYVRLPPAASASIVALHPELAVRLNAAGCLVVKLLKALYGLVVASQLWYLKLRDAFLSFGLVISTIDPCVFFGKIAGKDCILGVHVDDIVILCAEKSTVNAIGKLMDGVFTKANLDVSNPLAFIGMNITSNADSIYIDMTRYERECCTAWGVVASLDTPGDNNLFVDDDLSELLSDDKKKNFHTGAAKLLFLAKRTRPDVLTATSVCCGRVTKPTQQDWKRLDRIFRYLYGTFGYGVKFQRGASMQITCYGDASFASRVCDARSRTGVICMMAGGPIATKSGWQTLTTLCTPEAELVTMCEAAVIAIGCKNFLTSIGMEVPPIVLMEDNKTAIDYAHHGGPIHTRTRYIAVKYYFVKQHLDSGLIELLYCPTRDMLADMMTKSVTGALFVELRDGLLYRVPDELARRLVTATV